MNPQSTEAAASTRVAALYPVIQRKAAYLAGELLDADDVAQDMSLRILERTAADPDRLNQTDAYLMGDAWNNQRHALRSAVTESRRLTDAALVDDTSDDDEEGGGVFITVIDETADPETAAENAEVDEALYRTILSLSPTNRKVVAMLYSGHTEVQIARTLGITRSAVSQRKTTIARALSAALL